MRLSHKLLIATGALLFVTANVPPASAQINSNTGTVTLNATLSESLTVTVNSGSTVNFTLARVCDLQVELKPRDVPPSNLQTRH